MPKFSVRLGHDPTIAAFVHVEETTVNEDRYVAPRHDNVRLPRQIGAVQSVAQTHLAQQPANNHLGLRVLRADRSHVSAALLWIVNVHQASLCLTSCTNPFTSRIVIGLLGYCLWRRAGTIRVT